MSSVAKDPGVSSILPFSGSGINFPRPLYKRAMKKIIFNGQRRNKHFLIVIYHSSLVKGAMNAARLCKLRNDVKKTPQFLLFSMAKGGPSAQ
jgi:hypothetical protein